MKKVLMVIGGVAIAVVVILIVAAVFFIPRAFKLSGEATTYIQDAVPKIVTGWRSQELVDRATPQLMEAAKSREKIDQLFVMFSQLGALKHLDEPAGGIFASSYTNEGTKTVGNYKAKAEFENGTAEVQIQVLRVGEGWKINGFHINSGDFKAPTASPAASPQSPPTT